MLRGTRSIELFLSRVSRRGLCVIILTPMAENFAKDKPGVFEYLNSLRPLGHLGESLDIAYGILYLVSDESKFVTGSELVIDGGYTAR
jgi:NAD(P)-dependent dehydrogenase (short-subunit alcohol dehydrogenase family)